MSTSSTIAVVLSLSIVCICAELARADESELTFDQAQTRTSFARGRMEAAERELRSLERKEKSAYRSLSDAQKRYEEAKSDADEATRLREAAESMVNETRSRWEQESARLQRIHKENEARRRSN